METDNIEIETYSARVNIGVRVSPELKMELNEEAVALGQTSSEYAEAILHNRHLDKEEISRLNQLLAERDKVIEDSKLQRVILLGKHQEELAPLKKDVAAQKAQLDKLTVQNQILNDDRLIYLLTNLKGTSDNIKNPYGKNFDITYNSTTDVLRALIYGTKINK